MIRFLNIQGIIGIAASLVLAILLVVQKGETRHWHKQADQYQQLYDDSRAAMATTVANYRDATDKARTADQANVQRVATAAAAVNQEKANEYQARVADADARYERLRLAAAGAATNPGGGRAPPVPAAGADRPAPAGPAGQDRFSLVDRRLATDQAIQLDELIKAVRGLQAIDPNDAQQAH